MALGEVGRAAEELRSAVERLRVAVRALDDPAAAVVVASLGRESLGLVRVMLTRPETVDDPETIDVLAADLDADAMARLVGWIRTRQEVETLLTAVTAAADQLAG